MWINDLDDDILRYAILVGESARPHHQNPLERSMNVALVEKNDPGHPVYSAMNSDIGFELQWATE